jgi:hypothetical protein
MDPMSLVLSGKGTLLGVRYCCLRMCAQVEFDPCLISEMFTPGLVTTSFYHTTDRLALQG